MRGVAWLACGLVMAGCGLSETARLRPGAEATLFDEGESTVLVEVPEESGELFSRLNVPMGTRVVVVADNDGTGNDGNRKVQIRIVEGKYQRRSGKVKRHELRPE